MRSTLLNFIIVFSFTLIIIIFQSSQKFTYIVDEVVYLSQPLLLRNIARTLVYLFCYGVSVAAIFSIIFLKRKLPILILFVVFVVAYTTDWVFQLLGNPIGFDRNEYEIIRGAFFMAENTVEYFSLIAVSFLISLVLVTLLCFSRRYLFTKVRSDWFLVVPIIAIVSTTYASIHVFSINPSSFPAPIKLFAVGAYYEIELSDHTRYSREFDSSITVDSAATKNIIWIIDESVAGKFLSINGYPENTTPFLSSYDSGTNMFNFGTVNSVATSSALSNVLLRVGLQPKHASSFVEMYYTLPTIYHYAKHAGYRTTLFDMQMSNGTLQNGLNTKDMENVDNYITADRRMSVSIRDMNMLDDLHNILQLGEKNFIVIVKWGAHWPYQQSYPKSQEFFTPVLDTMFANIISGNRDRRINTYQNAIRYSADYFLERLIGIVDLETSRVIYTSDHGQNLASDSKRTHAGHVNVANSVVEVPLVIFQNDAKSAFDGIALNSQSSFQIFPTTLEWMGYGRDVVSRYGNTLDVPAGPELRSFFVTSTGELRVYAGSDQ